LGLGIKSNTDLGDVRINKAKAKSQLSLPIRNGEADCKEFFLRLAIITIS
jgi:hypothetical protein